jgi:predicted transcriptional regulator
MTTHQLVRDWMTRNPKAIHGDTRLPEIHAFMRSSRVRRLPVVDSQDRVQGIVTLHDVLSAKPSDPTLLSLYEMSYAMNRVSAADLMHKPVITVTPSTTVAECAQLMLDHKIGGIPVVDNEKLVGIITESDIFRMLVRKGI